MNAVKKSWNRWMPWKMLWNVDWLIIKEQELTE